MRSVCLEPGCGGFAEKRGYCSSHWRKRNRETHRTRGARVRKGGTWKSVRLNVLRRDGYICQSCGKFGDEVDHIVAMEDGGEEFDPENLQTLCDVCHGQKTNSEVRRRSYS